MEWRTPADAMITLAEEQLKRTLVAIIGLLVVEVAFLLQAESKEMIYNASYARPGSEMDSGRVGCYGAERDTDHGAWIETSVATQ